MFLKNSLSHQVLAKDGLTPTRNEKAEIHFHRENILKKNFNEYKKLLKN